LLKDMIQGQAQLLVVSLQSVFIVVPEKELAVPIDLETEFTLIHITICFQHRNS